MIREDILNSKEVKLAITLKTNQLKRESLESLTYGQVLQTLHEYVWKNRHIKNIHNAIDDVMKLSVSSVVAYLSLNAIERGSMSSLSDLQEFMKGD